jgi:hypothetical protein
MTMKRLKAVRFLRLDKYIRILQADKDNCTGVLEEFKYKNNLNTLLGPGLTSMNPCPKILQLR